MSNMRGQDKGKHTKQNNFLFLQICELIKDIILSEYESEIYHRAVNGYDDFRFGLACELKEKFGNKLFHHNELYLGDIQLFSILIDAPVELPLLKLIERHISARATDNVRNVIDSNFLTENLPTTDQSDNRNLVFLYYVFIASDLATRGILSHDSRSLYVAASNINCFHIGKTDPYSFLIFLLFTTERINLESDDDMYLFNLFKNQTNLNAKQKEIALKIFLKHICDRHTHIDISLLRKVLANYAKLKPNQTLLLEGKDKHGGFLALNKLSLLCASKDLGASSLSRLVNLFHGPPKQERFIKFCEKSNDNLEDEKQIVLDFSNWLINNKVQHLYRPENLYFEKDSVYQRFLNFAFALKHSSSN